MEQEGKMENEGNQGNQGDKENSSFEKEAEEPRPLLLCQGVR